MAQSKIEGLKEWNNWINSLPNELSEKVKEHVAEIAYRMEDEMKDKAPVDTGHLRRNINTVIDIANNGVTATVGSGTIDYAINVEFDTINRKATPYFFPVVAKYKPKFEKKLKEILREVGD